MSKFLKYLQFFLIAAITEALLSQAEPSSHWQWWRFVAGACLQGLISMKALQSDPESGDKPTQTEIVNPPSRPVETHEAAPGGFAWTSTTTTTKPHEAK